MGHTCNITIYRQTNNTEFNILSNHCAWILWAVFNYGAFSSYTVLWSQINPLPVL